MKTLKLLLTMVILVLCTGLFSQVYYENTTANEENSSSAIGKSTVATGVGAPTNRYAQLYKYLFYRNF